MNFPILNHHHHTFLRSHYHCSNPIHSVSVQIIQSLYSSPPRITRGGQYKLFIEEEEEKKKGASNDRSKKFLARLINQVLGRTSITQIRWKDVVNLINCLTPTRVYSFRERRRERESEGRKGKKIKDIEGVSTPSPFPPVGV